MIRGRAKRYNNRGTFKWEPCEIVRQLPLEGKTLIRYPGHWRVWVKAIANVESLGVPGHPIHSGYPGTPIICSGGGLG